MDLLTELVKRAGERVVILPGGGIRERNIHKVAMATKAKEIHLSGRTTVSSKMVFKNTNCYMGGALR